MTPQDVQMRVGEIRKLAVGDDEAAHAEEDLLHREVLQAIADGACEDPAGCARVALTTWDIIFSRWYA